MQTYPNLEKEKQCKNVHTSPSKYWLLGNCLRKKPISVNYHRCLGSYTYFSMLSNYADHKSKSNSALVLVFLGASGLICKSNGYVTDLHFSKRRVLLICNGCKA
jgi:hypothetical protein